MQTKQKHFSTILIGVIACFSALHGQTWESSGGGNWSASGNWSALPANDGSATVVFNNNPGTLTSNVDAPWSVLGLQFHTGSGAYTLSGETLSIGSGGLINATGVTLSTSVTSGSPTATITPASLIDASFLTPGTTMATGNQVPAGTTVAAPLTSTTFTMSANATGNDSNRNRVYGTARTLTLNNNIDVTADQSWSSTAGALILNGNLSGSNGITLFGNQSAGTTLPTFRLLGADNSAYTGTISFGSTTGSAGVLLGSASAMTGSLININGQNYNLWLTGGASSGTYTFGINGPETTGARVAFRGAGTSGLYLTGGDVNWDPGNGGNYNWSGTTGTIDFNGSNDSVTRVMNLGNSDSQFIISGANKTFRNAAGGNNSGWVNLLSALADGNEGSARTLTSSVNLVLNQAAVNNHATNWLNMTINGGFVAIDSLDQLPGGNLNISGGLLLLDGISWADFTAARGAGTGNGQFQFNGGGFAARGAAVTIDTTETTTGTFNRSFTLGSGARGSDGALYANAGVTIAQNTELTGQRTITVGANGVGLGAGNPVLNAISGNLYGAGSLYVTGISNTPTVGELVLSGTNTWIGAPSFLVNTNTWANAGVGGLIASNAIVRFDGNASLPGGATGTNTAFLTAVQRNSSTNFGFLLTGSALGETYDLPSAYRFMIGSMSSAQSQTGVFGADGGRATLQGSTVLLHSGNNATDTKTLTLLVRDDSSLTLGTAGNRVALVPSTGQSGSSSATATTVSDASGARTLIKRGEGTLVLGNLAYTDVAETGDKASQFTWQIGRGFLSGAVANTVATPYFDGAIRETGNTSANSLTDFNIAFAGGVLETNNSHQGGTFTRGLGSASNQVRWATGGGGFAAHGGDLTVNLGGASAAFEWQASNFVSNNNPLMFGSQTADSSVTFQNTIGLANTNNATVTREIRVIDNPGSGLDVAEISGNIRNRGDGSTGLTGTRSLIKTGEGTLILSGALNDYNGTTTVAAGTLLVHGGLTGTGLVTVESGAALGGNGQIAGGLNLASGALLAFNPTWTLTVNGDVTLDSTFGVASLSGLTSSVGVGYYTLIDGTSTNFASLGIQNFGADNAVSIGGGKSAYFTEGSLVLNVIPEPGTLLLVGIALGSLLLFRRRR